MHNKKNDILLVSDEEELAEYLKQKLEASGPYSVSLMTSVQDGLTAFKNFSYDLVIIKFTMPDLKGVDLVKVFKKIDRDSVMIAITDHHKEEAASQAEDAGIYDFISKPIDLEKLLFLVKKGIELRSFLMANQRLTQGLVERNAALEKQNILLARRIEDAAKNITRLYEDLRSTYMHTIRVLAQAIDARDHYTHSHSENVAKFAVIIANTMGLSAKEIEMLREASQLHDLGKIGIEDSILLKPSSLTSQEWEQIKRHPSIGAQILEPLTFLNEVIDMVRQHHEHFNGSGYPAGKKGEEIILGARIIHLADAYESMRSARSYRKIPLTQEEAINEIQRNNGSQFDPRVVEAFLKVINLLGV